MGTTLEALRTKIRWQAETDSARTDSDRLNEIINLAYASAWDTIIATYEDYASTFSDEFTLTGGPDGNTEDIDEDAGFYKLRAVQRKIGTRWSDPLPTFELDEMGCAPELSYRLMDSTLYFEPAENCAGTYRYLYVYKPEPLADGDELRDLNGAVEMFVIAACVALIHERDEDDASVMLSLQGGFEQKIAKMAAHRNAGRPKRVADRRGGVPFRFMTRSGRW